MSKKIGIVVLNYINYIETIECVNSLISQVNVDFEIVVVDNGSDNNSYEILKNSFNDLKVKILKLKKNYGFAKGMNVGITFFRNRGFENILVANSDLYFSSNNILKQLSDENDDRVGVIMPIVRNLDGTIEERECYRKKFLYLRIIKSFFKLYFSRNRITSKDIEYKENNSSYIGVSLDKYIIAGSCLMLTKKFLENYEGLYSKTFLYCEEQATIVLLKKAKLYTQICNTDIVIHKGAASSNKGTEKNIKKLKRQRESSIKIQFLLFKSKKRINKIIKRDNRLIYEENKEFFE